MQTKINRIIIKIGGSVIEHNVCFAALLLDIQSKILQDHHCVLVHGGGTQVSEYCKLQHITTTFDENGRRITSDAEMKITDMILGGSLNNGIVRLCTTLHINAVGISGADHGLVLGKSLNNTRTGTVLTCNTRVLDLLTEHRVLPVVNSVSLDKQGLALNINADEVAQALAQAWKADYLIYISDVEGVLENNQVIPKLTFTDIDKYIERGIISLGMITKTHSAKEAINNGVSAVVIGNYTMKGDLDRLLTQIQGTCITHNK